MSNAKPMEWFNLRLFAGGGGGASADTRADTLSGSTNEGGADATGVGTAIGVTAPGRSVGGSNGGRCSAAPRTSKTDRPQGCGKHTEGRTTSPKTGGSFGTAQPEASVGLGRAVPTGGNAGTGWTNTGRCHGEAMPLEPTLTTEPIDRERETRRVPGEGRGPRGERREALEDPRSPQPNNQQRWAYQGPHQQPAAEQPNPRGTNAHGNIRASAERPQARAQKIDRTQEKAPNEDPRTHASERRAPGTRPQRHQTNRGRGPPNRRAGCLFPVPLRCLTPSPA